MNQTIKKRIEDIKNGVVPEGYKKTKAGIVPIEWEEKRIGDVLTQRKTLSCVSEDAPLLSFTIEEGVIEPENKKSNKRDFLIKDINTKKFALTEVGDIIYNPANLKFGAIHRNNLRRGVVSPIYGIFYGAQNSEYMGYLLRNQRFIDYAKIYAEGTVEKLKTLGADTFKKLKITLPWLAEQEKIAEILETQDKVIKLKEKLVEQKKQQKKYLMQQLLTGKKRLPGFTGEWGKYKFNDLFNTIPAKNFQIQKNDYLEVGQYPVVDQGKVRIIGFSNNKEKLLKVPFGGVIVFGDHTREVHYINCDFVVGADGTQILFEKDQNISFTKYLYYVLSNKHIQNDGYSRHFKYVKEFNYKIPNIKEQQAIIDILSQADKEIELLQKDLEEEKNKKKALMQLLLTGIVRLC